MTRIALVMLFCVLPLVGQSQDITGPVAGFVHDAGARALRPVVGVPGSAYLGAPLFTDVEKAAVSPDGASALLVRGGRLYRAANLRSTPDLQPVEGAPEGIELLVWTGQGAAFSAPGLVQVLGKDPASVAGRVTALAPSSEGLLVGIEGEGVYLYASGAPRLLAAAEKPVALTPAGGGIYFADAGQIWEWRGGRVTILAPANALGMQARGGRLFIATADAVEIYDLATRGPAARLDLSFAASTLAAIGNDAVWLLAAAKDSEPCYVLDADQAAVYFVPAGREE